MDSVKKDDINIEELEASPELKRKTRRISTSKRRVSASGDHVSQSGQSEISTGSKRLESMLADFVEPSIPEPITTIESPKKPSPKKSPPKKPSPAKSSPRKSPVKVNEQSPSKISTSNLDLTLSDDSSADEAVLEAIDVPVIQEPPEVIPVETRNEPSPPKTMVLHNDLLLSDSSAEEDNAATIEKVPLRASSRRSSRNSSKSSPTKSVSYSMDFLLPEENAVQERTVKTTAPRNPSPQKSPRKSPKKGNQVSPSKVLVPNVDLVLSEESSAEEDNIMRPPPNPVRESVQRPEQVVPKVLGHKYSVPVERRNETYPTRVVEKQPLPQRKSPVKKPIVPTVRPSSTAIRKPIPKPTKERHDVSVFAKVAQPPSALNTKSTTGAPSIHGRKTITVREMQQQMMTKDKKEILERLRKEQENMVCCFL